MALKHNNEPREVGYSKDFAGYYQDKNVDSWLDKQSKSMFGGKNQKDLFIFAMAVGKSQEKKSDVKQKQNNVSVSAMTNKQKWALLSITIANSGNLLSLKDEGPMYDEAEKYAEEGIKIIKSHMDKYGLSYPKALEAELKETLQKSSV